MSISAKSVRFDDASMWIELSDGRTIGVPFAWFPRLLYATPEQRERVEIGRMGLHWEELDEDISIAGWLSGRDRTRRGRRERKLVEQAASQAHTRRDAARSGP